MELAKQIPTTMEFVIHWMIPVVQTHWLVITILLPSIMTITVPTPAVQILLHVTSTAVLHATMVVAFFQAASIPSHVTISPITLVAAVSVLIPVAVIHWLAIMMSMPLALRQNIVNTH
jgi:hypothetical protein